MLGRDEEAFLFFCLFNTKTRDQEGNSTKVYRKEVTFINQDRQWRFGSW